MRENNNESSDSNEKEIESGAGDAETTDHSITSDTGPQEASSVEQSSGDVEDESSDDLLEDVRRSLIEEASEQNKKGPKWWRRLGRKQKSAEPEPAAPPLEIEPSATLETEKVGEQEQVTGPELYEDQIDDLINMLEVEQQQSTAAVASVSAPEVAPEPEPEIDLEQLKQQAFRPHSPEEGQSDSEVRSIALEGGEEVFVEVEARPADAQKERLRALENALKPYRTFIYLAVSILGIVAAAILSLLLYNAYQQSRPQPVREVSNLPYPVAVSLPGGWSFNLGRGALQAGNWEPAGAEWLEGTEVCRWVSLPWSRQLEAVIRTLNPNDPIELVMSNNDKLVYGVYMVDEMTLEQIQSVDANTPCLLLILTGADSEARWVLQARP